MNNTLKSVGNIGAELAAAKAEFQLEMERHRKTWRQLEQAQSLLQRILNTPRGTSGRIIIETDEEAEIRAALSKQAEPRCEYCDGTGSRLTANFDGFPVLKPCPCVQQAEPAEPAPAQDERDQLAAEVAYYRSTLRNVLKDIRDDLVRGGLAPSWSGVAETIAIVLSDDRPAQTAPQPEQSGLVTEAMRNASIAEYDRHDGDFSDFADSVIRAALSAQG